MDAHTTILVHYYSYIRLKSQSSTIFHSCQTSVNPCINGIEQPCSKEKKDKCSDASNCVLSKKCKKCNALDSKPFVELMEYFAGEKPTNLSSCSVCFGNRILYTEGLYELEDINAWETSEAWIVGKVLVMCLFTDKYSQNSNLLSKMILLFRGKFSNNNTEAELNEFLNVFDLEMESIPFQSDLGDMLNQAIKKLEVHRNFSIPSVSRIVAHKLKQFCLLNQSELQFN